MKLEEGSLMGPVYAAAVILNSSIDIKLLKDSKSMLKIKESYYLIILKKIQLGRWQSSVKEIDK